MHKALVIKELRESAGIVVLAVLGVAYVLAELTATPLLPWQSRYLYMYPFVRDSLPYYLWLLGGGLAIVLGFRQTAWELSHGTYFFLLHRPVSRRMVFGCKLFVGALIVMLVTGLLLVLYCWWAATPGNFSAPFFWSMAVPAWQQWLSLPPIYFGAFLAGIRQGHWFGSRLVPLATGILAASLANAAPLVWLGVLLSAVVSVLFVIAIFKYVQTRDY